MEAVFAAEKVDLSIMDDWKDVQIALGLLAQRFDEFRITTRLRWGF